MHANGGYPHNLSNHAADDAFPSWSPDGQEITFVSNRDGNWEVYVMNADGTEQRRLTTSPAVDGHPVWSPEGEKIAFVSQRDGDVAIWIMDADGGNKRKLIKGRYPSWSPDSRKFVYRDEETNLTIFVILDYDETLITKREGERVSKPQWSFDGRYLSVNFTDNDHMSKIAVLSLQ